MHPDQVGDYPACIRRRHCERREAISSSRSTWAMAGKCFVATLLAMTKGDTDGGGIIADQVQSDGGVKPPQHSTTLTASPPFDVSLYLSRISRTVCRIVAIHVSGLTTWAPSQLHAER